jgi:hypothetical protein
MKFLDTLKSLVRPLLVGPFQVLSGGLGLSVALGGWLQVATVSILAISQTTSVSGALALALLLLFCQAASALLSFLIVNGSIFNDKPINRNLVATVSISGGILAAVLATLGTLLVAQFTFVKSILLVTASSSAVAAATGALIVLVISSLTKPK